MQPNQGLFWRVFLIPLASQFTGYISLILLILGQGCRVVMNCGVSAGGWGRDKYSGFQHLLFEKGIYRLSTH
jgi:hypothetical protein